MNINEIILVTKWTIISGGNSPVLVNLPNNCSWEDITGQPADKLHPSPNVYLIKAFVTDAVYTTINGDNRFIVLARRQYDDQNPGTYTINNFDDQPTVTQLNNFKTSIINRFPGVNEDVLIEAGQAVFRAGLSRIEIINLLAKRWQRFLKAIT
jgi:hypothetical protein